MFGVLTLSFLLLYQLYKHKFAVRRRIAFESILSYDALITLLTSSSYTFVKIIKSISQHVSENIYLLVSVFIYLFICLLINLNIYLYIYLYMN